MPYFLRGKKDIRKLFNSIYIKDYPVSWDDAKLRSIFEKYGPISLLRVISAKKDELSPETKSAYICYNDPTNEEI